MFKFFMLVVVGFSFVLSGVVLVKEKIDFMFLVLVDGKLIMEMICVIK